MSELFISPDPAALTVDAAQRILDCAQAAIQARGVFHIALSGGSTPKALFQLLATSEWAARFDWAKVHLWWGDERDVPADDPDSNFHMTREALIAHVGLPAANVHRVRTELGAAEAAAAYEADIVATIPPASPADGTPAFDLVLLGMGDDGHTASLFPGTAAIFEQHWLVIAHYVDKVKMNRVTFTPRLINAARAVAFLVSGSGKALTLRRVLYEIDQPSVLPSQIVAPSSGELWWMLDQAAAARLDETDGLGEGSLEDIWGRIKPG